MQPRYHTPVRHETPVSLCMRLHFSRLCTHTRGHRNPCPPSCSTTVDINLSSDWYPIPIRFTSTVSTENSMAIAFTVAVRTDKHTTKGQCCESGMFQSIAEVDNALAHCTPHGLLRERRGFFAAEAVEVRDAAPVHKHECIRRLQAAPPLILSHAATLAVLLRNTNTAGVELPYIC